MNRSRPDPIADSNGEVHADTKTPKVVRYLLKGWRPYAFLIIILLAARVGYYYYTGSEPGSETPSLRDQPPQYVDVYVSDPRVSVELIVNLSKWDSTTNPGGAWVNITARIKVPPPFRAHRKTVVVVTTNKVGGEEYPTQTAGISPERRLVNQPYMWFANFSDIRNSGFGLLSRFGNTVYMNLSFLHLAHVTEYQNGSLFAHLPSIGDDDYPGQTITAEEWPGTRRIRDLSYAVGNHTSDYSLAPPHGGPAVALSSPHNLSITEILWGGAAVLGNYQTDYMTPANEVRGRDYVWRSKSVLEPTFKLTYPDAADFRSQAAFKSGIAFGIAAAAIIALVQELPKDIPVPMHGPQPLRLKNSIQTPRLRRRTRRTKSATDHGAGRRAVDHESAKPVAHGPSKQTASGLGWPNLPD